MMHTIYMYVYIEELAVLKYKYIHKKKIQRCSE